MKGMKFDLRVTTTDIREGIRDALVSNHNRVRMAGLLGTGQEDYACAMLVGLSETIGIILSEACKEERERLVEFLPRVEDIIKRTANHIWKTHHLPDCGCRHE